MGSTVLVTGATGSQGFGVVRALSALPNPPTIHALVRDPSSSKAQELSKILPAVKLWAGTFEDVASIADAAAGCDCAFINLVPTFHDPELELTHLKNILETFTEKGSDPKYVIYSCGIGSEKDDSQSMRDLPGSGMFKTLVNIKHRCHQYVAQTCEAKGIPYTVLQPGHFYSNWLPPMSNMAWPSLASEKVLRCAFRPDLKLPCLDQTTLVGDTAAALIARRSSSGTVDLPRQIPLAGELLTITQIAETMARILRSQGSSLTIRAECLEEKEALMLMEQGKASPMMASHLYQNEREISVDVEAVRKLGVNPKSFEDFLGENLEWLQKAVGAS